MSQLTLPGFATTTDEHGMRDNMKFIYVLNIFWNYNLHLLNFQKNLFHLLQCFLFPLEGKGGYGALIIKISTLVKTARLSYCYVLSPLALPFLPNHEVAYTTMSSASVCIEAK